MNRKITINGKVLTAKWFAYDGCHKIYTLEDEEEKEEAKSYGYKILPIGKIRDTYRYSCPLRYIDSWNLKEEYIPQGVSSRNIRWEYYPKYEKKYARRREYVCEWDDGHDHGEFRFFSEKRAKTPSNYEDAKRQMLSMYGSASASRKTITNTYLVKD